MVDLQLRHAHDYQQENVIEKIGGPGIRTQVLRGIPYTPLPPRHLFLFVNIIQSNDNI